MKPPGSANALIVPSRTAEERELAVALRRLRGEARAERLQVFGDLGVVEDGLLVAQATHDLRAEPIFVTFVMSCAGGTADVRQVRAAAFCRYAPCA